jgi:glycosyltransferase involved in cell wall biosynthesis
MNVGAAGMRSRGIDLHCEYLGNLRSPRNLVRARQRIRTMSREFDVVHAQYGSACALVTEAAEAIPKMVTICGNDWNVYNGSIGFHYFHTRLARQMTRWSLRKFDAVITCSERLASDIQSVVPGAPTVPMPSPIDLRAFVPLDKQQARALLGYPDSKERWILFNAVNMQDPVKRFPLAKRAFDLANARVGNLRLRVATGLPHSELPLFTAACDLILCTSETEGWPNCVKEALACNVPFVATDVSDLKGIADVEPACRVCPPDAELLAASILQVLELPPSGNVRRFVEGMELELLTDRIIGIYRSAIDARRSVKGI